MWNLIVSVPDHCLYFYFKDMSLSQMKHDAKYQIFIQRIW